MTKRKVTQLFAVVALASGPAVATADHAAVHPTADHAAADHATARPPASPRRAPTVAPATPDPWAPAIAPPAQPAPSPAQAHGGLVESMFAAFGISVPRRLRTGAPACGNVAGRAPRPVDCK